MAHKIRLGFVGANVRATWASQSHFPALLASPDVELTAVCTTRPESAEEARTALGAKLAFHDVRAMVASPAIDAVAVVVRVPLHYELTRAAIDAGKHVYTEWPLGRTTAEAEELAALARSKGLQTAVGLQSRVSPTLMYLKEQIEAGYVGEVLACHATAMRDGALSRPSSRTWPHDARLGANTLTIATGHAIDALRFVAGPLARVACLVTTQARHPGPPRVVRAGDPRALHLCSGRLPPRRSVQHRADVCPVRRSDPDRAESPADVRHRR
jgi:predicted dehydrogenase